MSSHMEVKRDIDTGKEIFALTVEGLHIDQVEKVAVKLAKDKVVRPIVQTRVLLSTRRQDENHHRLSKNKDAQDAKYG